VKEFEIGDIVEQNGHSESPLAVTGYIHDQERLFVRDPSERLSKGDEFEIWTGEVTRHWRELPNVAPRGRSKASTAQASCSATTAARTDERDAGKFRHCELVMGHDGDHEATYCGSPFRWPNDGGEH
jgi:hypothetical protein